MKYGFRERLNWSQGITTSADVVEILKNNVPGCIDVSAATVQDDKSGTDWWCNRSNGKPLSVDLKRRDLDPVQRGWGDDLALETWSVCYTKVGWTRDDAKLTDFVLWLFPTGRWVLVPFPLLCSVYQDKWEAWAGEYKTDKQSSGTWESECTFVPRREVWAELYKRFGGSPKPGAVGGE